HPTTKSTSLPYTTLFRSGADSRFGAKTDAVVGHDKIRTAHSAAGYRRLTPSSTFAGARWRGLGSRVNTDVKDFGSRGCAGAEVKFARRLISDCRHFFFF